MDDTTGEGQLSDLVEDLDCACVAAVTSPSTRGHRLVISLCGPMHGHLR